VSEIPESFLSATLEEVFTLNRYFEWADCMRGIWENTHDPHERLEQLSVASEEFFLDPSRSYWYSGIYVVIEGWRELGLHDTEIDHLLESPHVETLRRYRNGVFHYQRKYFDDRFLNFTAAGGESAAWVVQLTAAFDRWFREYSSVLEQQEEEPGDGAA
jgi:hypothetical protein